MAKKFTKSEKQSIIFFLGGLTLIAFISDPISEMIKNIIPTSTTRLLIGFVFIFLIAYFGRLNKFTWKEVKNNGKDEFYWCY